MKIQQSIETSFRLLITTFVIYILFLIKISCQQFKQNKEETKRTPKTHPKTFFFLFLNNFFCIIFLYVCLHNSQISSCGSDLYKNIDVNERENRFTINEFRAEAS